METTVSPANKSVCDICLFINREARIEDYISAEMYLKLTFSLGLVSAVIAIVGMGANIVNLATFVKMGFQDTINITLTALAATDLASLFCLLCNMLFYTPQMHDLLSDTIDVTQVDYITQGITKSYLTTVAGFITSLVAVERCLCVLMPLQVKIIFTKKRLVRALAAIFVLVWSPYLPICFTTRLGWVFRPDRNRTILSLIRDPDVFHIDGICFSLIAIMNVSCYVTVFVSTVIIVWKLASQSAWRAAKTTDNAQKATGSSTEAGTEKKAAALSGRDRRATKTVTFIATMYIVCSFPAVVVILTMSFVPDFNKGMLFNNIYDVAWSVVYVGEGISSSANILIYLKTSAKYRETFMKMFRSQ